MIKTYEEAIEVLGIKHFDETGLTTDEIAYKKLKVITKVLNDGWEADWRDTYQRKFIPLFDATWVFALYDTRYNYSYPGAGSSSRLCFRDRETAEYAGRTFTEMYKQFIICSEK